MECSHLGAVQGAVPNSRRCEACVASGDVWVQLRMCLTCGHVGCCDSSVGRHATKHFQETGHPIMQSFKSAPAGGTEWRFCYIDKEYVD